MKRVECCSNGCRKVWIELTTAVVIDVGNHCCFPSLHGRNWVDA